MKTSGLFLMLIVSLAVLPLPRTALSQEASAGPDIYSGYYAREDNDGELARQSGHSHYLKFFPGNRIARLYIPYPYSTTIAPATIDAVFDEAVKQTSGSAYIRDTFGLLDRPVMAQLDFLKEINGELLFDCGSSNPCRMEFTEEGLRVIKKGIVTDHATVYYRVQVD